MGKGIPKQYQQANQGESSHAPTVFSQCTVAMTGQGYNQLGRFTIEGDTDLVWRREEGEAEQVAIATWVGDGPKLRLLTLATSRAGCS